MKINTVYNKDNVRGDIKYCTSTDDPATFTCQIYPKHSSTHRPYLIGSITFHVENNKIAKFQIKNIQHDVSELYVTFLSKTTQYIYEKSSLEAALLEASKTAIPAQAIF